MDSRDNKKDINLIKISQEKWGTAQDAEFELWKKSSRPTLLGRLKYYIKNKNRGNLFSCSDDWNFWWLKKFDNYSFLKDTDNAIEVGCGPFSNMRLISKKIKCSRIYLSDPLIKKYIKYTNGFVREKARSGEICIDDSPAEDLPYKDNYFDLVVLINVLDHVRDAEKVISECIRVARKNGCLLLGQDLTNDVDIKKNFNLDDPLHPIRVDHIFLDNILDGLFSPIYLKILPREEGRNPDYHYATYLYAGIKK